VLPLDGGNIVTAVAEAVFGRAGRVVARCLSLGLTISLAVWAAVSKQLWLAIIAAMLTLVNWQALRAERGPRAGGDGSAADGLRRLQQAVARRDWAEVVSLVQSPVGRHLNDHILDPLAREARADGAPDAAAELGAVVFQRSGRPETAVEVARALARAGRPAEALVWLELAVNAGLDDRRALEADPELAPVRAEPGYGALRAKLS
jgi:hypothetical protein